MTTQAKKQYRSLLLAALKEAGTNLKMASKSELETALVQVINHFSSAEQGLDPEAQRGILGEIFSVEISKTGLGLLELIPQASAQPAPEVAPEEAPVVEAKDDKRIKAIKAAIKMSRVEYEEAGHGKIISYIDARLEATKPKANSPVVEEAAGSIADIDSPATDEVKEAVQKAHEPKTATIGKEPKAPKAPKEKKAPVDATEEEVAMAELEAVLSEGDTTLESFLEVMKSKRFKGFNVVHKRSGTVIKAASVRPSRVEPERLSLIYKFDEGKKEGGTQFARFTQFLRLEKK